MTIFFLFGRGLPIESKVALPIIIALSSVFFLKKLRSSFISHGILPFFPMAKFLSTAAIRIIYTRPL